MRLITVKLILDGLFKAPLNIEKRHWYGFYWQHQGDSLCRYGSQGIDIKATSAWVAGDFRYQKQGEHQQLSILSGVNVTDAGETWRYLPEKNMSVKI